MVAVTVTRTFRVAPSTDWMTAVNLSAGSFRVSSRILTVSSPVVLPGSTKPSMVRSAGPAPA
jgi:hypothetical protein